jgi:TonB family protein
MPPSYPRQAVENRERGTVQLECRIDVDGIVRDCKVTRKVSKLLDAEALACVAQWRYQPLKLAGEQRAALVNLTVQFRLG